LNTGASVASSQSGRSSLPAVIHLAAEFFPYARTGGLAEAVSGLASFQHRAGHRVVAMLPLYRSVRELAPGLVPAGDPYMVQVGAQAELAQLFRVTGAGPGPEVYAIAHPHFYDRPGIYGDANGDYEDSARRFAFLVLAALEALPRFVSGPTILHAHDWHTALAPLYLRTTHADRPVTSQVGTVLAVHNPGYQGHFPASIVPDIGLPWSVYTHHNLEWYGRANLLKGGVTTADLVVTVSAKHAEELKTDEGGFGLQEVFRALGPRLVGITNGIDQSAWDPTTDPHITATYGPADFEGKERCKTALQRAFGLPQRKKVPIFGFSGRLAQQKGLDVIFASHHLLSQDAQFVFLGGGERRYGDTLLELRRALPDRVGVELNFTDRMEHRLMAGADMFMMPSVYEPCGLTQMRAQRYGTLPVGRRVGGIADTVEDGVTGFLFDKYDASAFQEAAFRALAHMENRDRWNAMMRTAMHRDFSWDRASERYAAVYRSVLASR
jgi:starch synthase